VTPRCALRWMRSESAYSQIVRLDGDFDPSRSWGVIRSGRSRHDDTGERSAQQIVRVHVDGLAGGEHIVRGSRGELLQRSPFLVDITSRSTQADWRTIPNLIDKTQGAALFWVEWDDDTGNAMSSICWANGRGACSIDWAVEGLGMVLPEPGTPRGGVRSDGDFASELSRQLNGESLPSGRGGTVPRDTYETFWLTSVDLQGRPYGAWKSQM
jgi:hypothetical protein